MRTETDIDRDAIPKWNEGENPYSFVNFDNMDRIPASLDRLRAVAVLKSYHSKNETHDKSVSTALGP